MKVIDGLQIEYGEECGWLVKGHGHSEDALFDALLEFERGRGSDGEYYGSPLDHYESREIWMRKAQTYFSRGEGYAYEMQITEPHARGAGRFTFIDMDRPRFKPKLPPRGGFPAATFSPRS